MARNTAQTDLDQALAAAAGGRRVILRRGGKRFAIITGDDLARLEAAEAAEDRADGEAIAAALAEQGDEPPTPHVDVLAALGLTE